MHALPFSKRLIQCLLVASVALVEAGCASAPFDVVNHGRPIFRPEKYFAGRTHSWGVFETRGGQPKEILRTQTSGRWVEGVLHFEQDLEFQSGKKSHRSWKIRRVGEHRYTATGTGIVGVARGEAHGNAFHLEFTLDAVPGNPLAHLHMLQWLYLQEDGVTLINRAKLTKAGITVADITEQFRKDR